MPAKKRSSARAALRTAADVLSDIAALRVALESGEVVELDLAKELEIPRDPAALAKAARRAPAQVAFWNYQTERALDKVRGAETKLAEEEGKHHIYWKAWYEQEENETPPQGTLRARLDCDLELRRFRVALRARRKEYGRLRAVRDAVDHRAWTVRTLIGQIEPT